MRKKVWLHSKRNDHRSLGMVEGQVIITGASKGIGAGIAEELHRRGYAVVNLSRSGEALVGESLACDVADESDVKVAVRKIASQGPIIGLVNNAGLHINHSASTVITEEFERVMRLNTTAVMMMSREVYPYLKSTQGMVINIGSFFDKLGVPENLAYCASKAAVAAMTRVMAVEWAADGISVINVAPGYIETDMNRDYLNREKVHTWMSQRIPVGRPGQVNEVARMVVAIFSENISFLTGETIYIDGGHGINH